MNSSPDDPSARVTLLTRFVLLGILVLALYWRSAAFAEHPSMFHLPRYLVGAIRARQLWLEVRPQPLTSDEQAWLDADVRPFAEPPLLEALTVLSYLPDGHERPWVAQLWSSVFWLLAGWPVYAVGRRLSDSPLAALAGLAVFYLAPLAIVISQMFQPESLLVLGLATSLAALVRWPPQDCWRSTLVCGAICGATSLVKPGALLLLLGAAYSAGRVETEWRERRSVWRWLIDPRSVVFALLLALPSVAYARLFLPTHLEARFVPELALTGDFYRGWFEQVGVTVGWPVVVAGLLGAEAHRRRRGTLIPWGLWIGYLATSYFFTWHTPTHNYYQTPLVLVTAVGVSGLAAWLLDRVPLARVSQGRMLLGVYAALALCAFYPLFVHRLTDLDARYDIAALIDSAAIRRQIPSGTPVLCFDGASGYLLSYYAWLVARPGPTTSDRAKNSALG